MVCLTSQLLRKASMSSCICTCRTNYFRVKDRKAFDEWASKYEVRVIEDQYRVGLVGEDPDGGSWPSHNSEKDEDIDFAGELAKHLVDGNVAILMEVGAEKVRYVYGAAIAVKSDGSVLSICLDDVYKLVEDTWGIKPSPAEY